jgi:hypothetical protein
MTRRSRKVWLLIRYILTNDNVTRAPTPSAWVVGIASGCRTAYTVNTPQTHDESVRYRRFGLESKSTRPRNWWSQAC